MMLLLTLMSAFILLSIDFVSAIMLSTHTFYINPGES